MAINSMTGFARTDGEFEGASWHWEIKSVNGKSLDMRARLPQGLDGFEAAMKEIAARHLRRGNLQVSLHFARDAAAPVIRVNTDALEQILAIAGDLRQRLDAPAVTVEGVMALRGVLEQAEAEQDADALEARNQALLQSFEEACIALAKARASEGQALGGIVRGQIDALERLSIAARDCPQRSPEAIRQRLEEQIARITDASSTLDPDRLHQEVVLMAAKADIREELDRLFAHVAAARELLDDGAPVGRKFDFLAQEFNREANTLCSKSNAPELSAIGLDMKSVIDQLREQVQNIE